jgi:prephenate dehydrogenase
VPLASSIVTIVGMGLMGGSLGMALVKNNACKEVRALVRRNDAIENILARDAAHIAGTDEQQLLENTDLLVLATPVLTIEAQVSELHRFLKTGAIITDMGSVKKGIVEAMDDLPPYLNAVGGHPMCGKETSGITSADPMLFRERVWVLTPSRRTDPKALSLVEAMIELTGARRMIMDAESHDAAVSCISHLPYILAMTLMEVAENAAVDRPEIWELAASGFRDTSRLAGSDLTMMIDILASNRTNVVRMMNLASTRLNKMIELISDGKDEPLLDVLSKIRDRRMGMFRN